MPSLYSTTLRVTFTSLLAIIAHISFAHAELTPHHVAILANSRSPESMAVAQHYAAQRQIPVDHIIRLDIPLRETITRQEYEELVVAPLRHQLDKRKLAPSIRVIVTTYGIPLRIEAPTLSEVEKTWLSEAQQVVHTSRTKLDYLERAFERMVPNAPPRTIAPPDTVQNLFETARTIALLSRIDQAWQTARKHMRQLSPSQSERTWQDVRRLTQQYRGWGSLLEKEFANGLHQPSPDRANMDAWRTVLAQTAPYWDAIDRHPIPAQRPLISRWVERLFGTRGLLQLASAEVDRLTYAHADASFDSELSLLWWDRDLYPVAWRWNNPFFHEVTPNQDALPILMVSRLDAPTSELAKRLIDNALRAEREGLHGTVYFDARGLQSQDKTDTYGRYDQSLRDAAALTKVRTAYRVVLDNSKATMLSASNVALYIGWYKLRAYEDVFSFNPGAIGYHMASAEAVTVHNRDERGWCKNALEHGITATLGSVGEPYLDAFPEPASFTLLLWTGKYTLAELYYLTSRYLSWRMVLFGDPLYNPMKGRSTTPLPPSLPIPPSERRFGDPIAQAIRAHDLVRDHQEKLISLLLKAEHTITPITP